MVYCDVHWGKLCIVSPSLAIAFNILAWGAEDMKNEISPGITTCHKMNHSFTSQLSTSYFLRTTAVEHILLQLFKYRVTQKVHYHFN